MGITGLWKIVEPTSCEIPLECLEGKKLAVDVSIWIYQAQMAYPSDSPYPHLRLLINRLCKLLFYKIRPVFVFDGPNVPDLKKQVLDSRRAKKLADDSILQNPKKLQHLKQIASGQLDDQQLAKSVQTVISPTKRVLLNDVYSKEAASTSSFVVNLEEKERVDQIYEDSGSDFSDGEGPIDEKDEKSYYDKIVEDLKIPENATRRQTIDTLVERRETMRKSRLNPSMIPTDSQDFSNFQMQRLLRRGRLNAQIDQIAKNPTSQGENSSKIHVLGPDGTQHILKYSHSDEVQEILPGSEIFKGAVDGASKNEMNLSLDIFSEACDFKKPTKSREITPEDQEIAENFKFQSKSGMLEAIARKRVRMHYRKCENEEESSDDEFVDVLEEEEVGTSTEVRVGAEKNSNEVEWDPEKPDRLEKSSQNSEILDENDGWIKMNYEDNDKTPEMYRDLQEFLTNCGIPWLEAPGEAEAQCVELEKLGLVDGVISDDSDVWPFGVKNVYRHMFAKNKRVQRYSAIPPPASNDNIYCLEREDYISIGILAGGDYSSGLNKVGAIGALELVAEFVEVDRNLDSDNVENRIFKLLQIIEELFLNTVDDLPSKSRQALFYRRHVVEANEATKIRQICENHEAVRAYLHPNVDSSSEKFRWRKMNIELIRNIMQKRFDDSNFLQNELKNSISAFERWNTFLEGGGVAQMRLDRFFMAGGVAAGKPALIWSKKVTDALLRISRRSRGTPQEEIIVESVKKRNTKKTTKKPVKKKKKVEKEEEKLNLSEESSDDSF